MFGVAQLKILTIVLATGFSLSSTYGIYQHTKYSGYRALTPEHLQLCLAMGLPPPKPTNTRDLVAEWEAAKKRFKNSEAYKNQHVFGCSKVLNNC